MSHVDETGAPCARHPELASVRLYELAILGSRMRTFNHELASKLQALMMAVDEARDISEPGEPSLRVALDSASAALRGLRDLLDGSRALANPGLRTRVSVHELIDRAADRCGVKVRGQLDECQIRVSVSAMTHAFAQLLDLASGAGLQRVAEVSIRDDTRVLAVSITGTGEARKDVAIEEMVALAAHAVEREGGSLACGASGFTVRLPVATGPAAK